MADELPGFLSDEQVVGRRRVITARALHRTTFRDPGSPPSTRRPALMRGRELAPHEHAPVARLKHIVSQRISHPLHVAPISEGMTECTLSVTPAP